MIEDFNDIIKSSEKLGGQLVYFNNQNFLIDFMNSTRMVDLSSLGSQFNFEKATIIELEC